jgi:hypothetical protein
MKRIIEEEKREEKACLVIRAKVRGTEQGSKFSFAKSSSRPSQSSRDAHPSIESPSQDVATSSNTAKTTRPESGMSSDTRVPASGTSVPRKFEFSRSTETTHVLDEDWDDAYYASERWAEEWVVTQDPDRPEWPLGIKIYEHKMYWYEKLCVPETVTGRVIRAHHAEIGHVGGKKLWKEMQRWYHFAPGSQAEKLAETIPGQCETCQAHNPTNLQLKGTIEPSIVPPTLGESVSIDIFDMPNATWNGESFDAMAVCVDRGSGWTVAVPQLRKGLTAKKVAIAMYRDWWEPFGIPSIITSDRGPQFAGAWWTTICAQVGIRRAYSQAYHHQANGRAEVIGRDF